MYRLAISLGLFLSVSAHAQGGFAPPTISRIDSSTLMSSINQNCISAQIVGSCPSLFCPDCVILDYYQAVYAVTLVKIPGDRLISDAALTELLGPGVHNPITTFFGGGVDNLIGGGGGDKTKAYNKPAKHYYESRVYTLPQPFAIACGLCGRTDVVMTVNYVSDHDAEWRLAEENQIAQLVPDWPSLVGLGPLRVWGSITPVSGHHVHGSPVVAAAADAAKAVWVVSTPAVPPRPIYMPGEPSSCFQPAWPIQMPCMPVGMPPPLWDVGHVSPEGKYLYIFWTKRTCCLPTSQATCALATSGQGENFCALQLPSAAAGLAAYLAGTQTLSGGR